jgi:DNA-binding response OmpR family regulator
VLPSSKAPSILLVEDDSVTRELYRIALKAAGYHVKTAGDGVEALIAVDSELPAAIVLDLGLPRLSGYDVRQELAVRADTSRIPILIVTGTDTTGVDLGDEACVIYKPVDPERLVNALADCLRQSAP